MMLGRRLGMQLLDGRHAVRLASRFVRRRGRGPELLCQFVTSRCDALCAHCFDHAWRGPAFEDRDLETWELAAIAANLPRLYFVILTGGEPFLRSDLAIVAAAYARGARPAVLAIPTNGGRTESILATVDELMLMLPEGVTLSVNVSLDGLADRHDAIRGVPGLYARALRTVEGLRERASRHDDLVTGVITVVSQANQDQLEELERKLLDELDVQSWAPFLVRGSPRDPSLIEPALEAYEALAVRLEARAQARNRAWTDTTGFLGARVNRAKNAVRRGVISRTLREERRIVPCRAGELSAVIRADGTLWPCELLDAPMGNLRQNGYDLGALWRDPRSERVRERVRLASCACTHENTLSMGIAYDWRSWRSMLAWTLAFERLPGGGF